MFQLGLIRLVMNFVIGLLSNLRTIIWLVLMVLIIGYGYLLYANGFDFGSAWSDITGYMTNIWNGVRGAYVVVRDGLFD